MAPEITSAILTRLFRKLHCRDRILGEHQRNHDPNSNLDLYLNASICGNPFLSPKTPPVLHFTMNRGGGGGGRKVLLPPINFIFKLLQQHSTVQIWLYEQLAIRIEGRIRVSGNY